ncbi:MAG: hypothetical protein STSR0008_12100 [Ignavibacterium sp.]
MAAKLPVLVSDIDGPMEIIKNGKYGSYFEVGDHNDLANKLLEIKNKYNANCFDKKNNEIYDYIKNNFDIKLTAKNI